MSTPKLATEIIQAAAEAAFGCLQELQLPRVEFKGCQPSVSDPDTARDSTMLWEVIIDGLDGKRSGGITPEDIVDVLDELCTRAQTNHCYRLLQCSDASIMTLIRNDGPR